MGLDDGHVDQVGGVDDDIGYPGGWGHCDTRGRMEGYVGVGVFADKTCLFAAVLIKEAHVGILVGIDEAIIDLQSITENYFIS